MANDPEFQGFSPRCRLGGVEQAEFESVLSGASAGAEWAWSRLYGSLSPTVLGYLRARGAAEPEDLLGEVWLHVARRLTSFEGDHQGFRSWVFMIAHHRLIDERRKRGRRPITRSTDGTDIPAASVGQTDPAMASIEREELTAHLCDLPEQQQSVVLLRVVADLSVDQTADVLGISPSAVKSAQYRAVKNLRRVFEKSATDLVLGAVTEVK